MILNLVTFGLLCLTALIPMTDLRSQDQGEFTVEMSDDTILLGNILEVKFTIENIQGDFMRPDFNEFQLVGGPNTSSQFSMVNGRVTQSASYTYYLKANLEGEYEIGSGELHLEEEILRTDPVRIIVLPNPDETIRSPERYGYRQNLTLRDTTTMSEKDSLLLKLRKLRGKKI